jgi:hypothetical protein
MWSHNETCGNHVTYIHNGNIGVKAKAAATQTVATSHVMRACHVVLSSTAEQSLSAHCSSMLGVTASQSQQTNQS